MRIVHRISNHLNASDRQALARLGVTLNETMKDLITFEVDEAHAHWPAIAAWTKQKKAFDWVSTEFTQQEIGEAEWLELGPGWHHGYPQPHEDDFGYLSATHDLKDYCDECGIGLKQKAPFQMKGEPKWGRRGILQLNWVFDQFFVTPEVWAAVFKPHGVECRPVFNRKGVELETVVQLSVFEEVSIVTKELPAEVCGTCKRVKYLPVVRGPFPALAGAPQTAMVWTQEYFGSGGSAHHAVLVSKELAQAFLEAGVRGASLKPVQNIPRIWA